MRKSICFVLLVVAVFALFSSYFQSGITLDLETNTALSMNVYYYAGNESGYPYDEAHKSQDYYLEPCRQTVRIPLSREDMQYLRFDFDVIPARITVYEMVLRSAPFMVYRLDGEAFAELFPIQNCIAASTVERGAVVYDSIGIDGFVAADKAVFAQLEAPDIQFGALAFGCGMLLLVALIVFTPITGQIVHILSVELKRTWRFLAVRNAYMVKRYRHYHQYLICGGAAAICMAVMWTGARYILINLAYSLGLGLCVSVIWEKIRKLGHEARRDLVTLVVVTAVAALPMMLTTFYYGDDYGSYYLVKPTGLDYSGAIGFRRPMVGAMAQMLRKLDYRVLHLRRSVMVLVLLLCVILIYELLLYYHGRRRWAFSVSLLFTAGVATLDSIAYLSTAPILYGLLFSLCAFTYYQRAREESKWNYLVFVFLLLEGFCFYQIATPILFVPFLFALYHSQERESENFKNAFKLLVSYGVVAVGYLLSTKLLLTLYGVAPTQASRAEISLKPFFYVKKLRWFCMTVLPQSVNKAFALLFGMRSFTTNNLFYAVHFRSSVLETLVLAVSTALVVVYLARFLLRRRYATVFIAVVGIVLSFYPFLILPESYTLSYYMIPLIVLMGYYILSGFWILWDIAYQRWEKFRIAAGRVLSAGCVLTVIVLAANGSAYTNNWVNYNRDSYQYIKQSLAQSVTPTTQTVMVCGVMSPYAGGGNAYVVLATRRAMDELGMDSDYYTVLQSDNAYYATVMTETNMAIMKTALSEEEYEAFSEFYIHDDLYSRFLYAYSADQDDLLFLQKCMVKAGLLFEEPSDSVCIIYLDGFSQVHEW